MNADDPSKLSMLELFRVEAEYQTAALTAGLLELERRPEGRRQKAEVRPPTSDLRPLTSDLRPPAPVLEILMRAAHSLKGAAVLVHVATAVHVAHKLEDVFVAAQLGRVALNQPQIDTLLRGVDLL